MPHLKAFLPSDIFTITLLMILSKIVMIKIIIKHGTLDNLIKKILVNVLDLSLPA